MDESWSEAGLFMYLGTMWLDIRHTPPGSDSLVDPLMRESVERLLLEWLTICSVDTGKLH